MSKVLKITKSDKSVHVVPMINKSFYQSYNNRLPVGKKWKIEEIDEKDAQNLPFIDESHVSPLEAQAKVNDMNKQLTEKDQQIAALKQLLEEKKEAEQQAKANETVVAPEPSKEELTAATKTEEPVAETKNTNKPAPRSGARKR